MIRKYWDDPLYRFLMKAVFLYAIWYLFYQQFLHPMGCFDLAVIGNLETISTSILHLLGFDLINESEIASIRTIGIDGTHGLWIGDPCNGLTLFALFTGFILAYPGPWRTKLWFIPLGMVTIHILNVIRIVSLALIVYFFPDPEILDFNHTYTFTLVVYSYVFFLWYIWAKKYSNPNQPLSDEDPS
jgi:exosortase family protein XrtF